MNDPIEILLIEDDPGDVHLALAVFRALKIADRCAVANDGEDGMDFLYRRGRFAARKPGAPRLILLDLKMPRANGFDFLQVVKKDPGLALIPIVALTSSREERDVERAYDLGVNGYVVKGIDFSEYRTTLRSLALYWTGVNDEPPAYVERGVASLRAFAGRQLQSLRGNLSNPWLWPMGAV
ncbi:MAG TPA: response regulator [Burkholderiales bacterium]|nr:response regulator [Burkholderiales bacterium]